jgi:hypothetical protein
MCSQFFRPRAIGRIPFSTQLSVHLDPPVAQNHFQSRPQVECILTRPPQQALGQRLTRSLLHQTAQLPKKLHAPLCAQLSPARRIQASFPRLLFHSVNFPDPQQDEPRLHVPGIHLQRLVKLPPHMRQTAGAPDPSTERGAESSSSKKREGFWRGWELWSRAFLRWSESRLWAMPCGRENAARERPLERKAARSS